MSNQIVDEATALRMLGAIVDDVWRHMEFLLGCADGLRATHPDLAESLVFRANRLGSSLLPYVDEIKQALVSAKKGADVTA
jgi:hypothetical protein